MLQLRNQDGEEKMKSEFDVPYRNTGMLQFQGISRLHLSLDKKGTEALQLDPFQLEFPI